jgi:hypothetical protein
VADTSLDRIAGQTGVAKTPGQPPLHLWHPPLSGAIDIVIRRDGSWWHEGARIRRDTLVRLFASILRREEDGEYYLVTPVEKWRLQVECLPLLVLDFECRTGKPGGLVVTLNTGRELTVDSEHPLFLPDHPLAEGIPAVQLDHGLAALFSRPAWYRLAELCQETQQGLEVRCGEARYILG